MNSQVAAGNPGALLQDEEADNAASGAGGPLRQNQTAPLNQHLSSNVEQQMVGKIKKEALAPSNSGKDQRLLISNLMQSSAGPFNNAAASSAQTG